MPYGLTGVWPWRPAIIILLLVLCILYVWRLRQVRQKQADVHISRWRVFSFFLGILFMALALLTPLDTIARTQLFLAHMIQVILLTTFCAPLMLIGTPDVLLRPAMNAPVARGVARLLTLPLADSIIFNLVFLLWHAPLIYHAALRNESWYQVEMVSIFLVSLLNWWPIVGSVHEYRRLGYPVQIVYTFFDGLPIDTLAFVLVYTGVVIYPYYVIPAQLGISANSDQAAAGALLLLPGVVDFLVMSPLFFKWLEHMERQTRLADERRQAMLDEQEEEIELYDVIESEEVGEISEA